MYSFANDYSEGACPKVLEALTNTNYNQTPGYGVDKYCLEAEKIIRNKVGNNDVDVHFITGGTPCNVLAISLLKSYEAVICVESGHINVHETGAVEATGHKILSVKGVDGKITPEEIQKVVDGHGDEHMVKPRMVFISNATEFGTIYTLDELKNIYKVCKDNNLYLYLDGARLSNALVASGNDITLKDICTYTDLFYIGGTKNGALLGEAMVIKNPELKPNFRYTIKQHNAMLAKGRVIGVSFIALMEDDTYLKNAKNANIMAQALKYILEQMGAKMYIDSSTNQIFPILENSLIEKMKRDYEFIVWDKYDRNHSVIRLVCSWATRKEDIQQFYNDLLVYINEK